MSPPRRRRAKGAHRTGISGWTVGLVFVHDEFRKRPGGHRQPYFTESFSPLRSRFAACPPPAKREFEDGAVNFASVRAAPQDLARLLLVKFALEYSNDWFLLPLELPVGTVSQIRALVVTNTFGERFLISHTTDVDGPTTPWRMFSLTNDTQKLFFLPPVLGPMLESRPVEDLSLLRDEMANVAWAVERVVESAAGRPLDRHEAYQETLEEQPPAPAADSAPLTYWVRHHGAGLLDSVAPSERRRHPAAQTWRPAGIRRGRHPGAATSEGTIT